MTEYQWDKKLNIKTTGRDASKEDVHHYPYEPTPYSVLERLAESGCLSSDDLVVDYGCGKGRVGLYLAHKIGCRTIGVEFDVGLYQQACENAAKVGRECRSEFVCDNAEDYNVKDATAFYFFNPFSVEILQVVLRNILLSYYEEPRRIQLFFYYPNDEYVAHMMSEDAFLFVDEIECKDLFPGKNERERILIFEVFA